MGSLILFITNGHHILLTSLPTDDRSGCFQTWAVTCETDMNNHKSLCNVFISLGWIPRCGIAGSRGKVTFNFLRNCQTVFHGGCATLYSHQPRQSSGRSAATRVTVCVMIIAVLVIRGLSLWL